MRKSFIKVMFFGALAFATSTSFVGCKDYDDDINRLDKEISNVKDAIKSLEDKVGSGKYVESCVAITEGNGGYEIKFSDGQTVKIYNGAKGENGAPGAPGTPGTPGAPGSAATDYVVSVTVGETAYELIVTYADGSKKTISMPKATSTVTGIKFMPSYLSEGEAARIHFPTIVTDSLITDIKGDDFSQNNYKNFGIVYSGKAEVKYQVNPQSVSFDNFEVAGFVRDTAEIWNYSTNDKKWMLFDKGQAHYSDGKLTKAASYAEGHGVISFRAKDWAFAEQANWNERTVYSFRLKNGDHIVHSDFVPAKHEVILQKNVHLAKIAETGDAAKADHHMATAPNTTNYREFIADTYYKKQVNPTTLEEYEKNKAVVEANAENTFYKGAGTSKSDARIHVKLPYDGGTKELKDIVLAYFNNRAGRDAANEYVLNENGFDDYSLEFEAVDFYYDGVNQTKRYLEVSKDGAAKVRLSSDWGEVPNASHTAAIDRTPIVRVKLVAPGEDNKNVVKTAIIKILIVKTETPQEEIVIKQTKEVTLMHINQLIDMDMDQIFFHAGVQLSKDEFRKTYKFTTLPGTVEADDQTRVSLADLKTATGQEFNQLQVTVKNTAFSVDHVTYLVKGVYKAIPAVDGGLHPGAADVNIEYTIKVKYPTVVPPTKTTLNWAGDNHFIAHGRLNKANPALGQYEMVSVLDNMFDLNNYKPYGSALVKNDDARAVLSFELVDQHNHASNVAVSGDESGIELYQTAEGKWEIALQPTDAGRNWINEEGSTAKRIKMRAVISFNECVDGLYGTCTTAPDAHFKYSKKAQDAIACDTINVTSGTPKHTQNYASNNGKAPEQGRSTVVIKEFEVAFVTPMVFHSLDVPPLYDKYEGSENTRFFNTSFFLADYLYANGAQESFKEAHIVYDNKKASKTGFDANGWANKWVTIFDANKTVHYELGDATFDDGSGKLDAENMKKIKFDQAAGTVTWVNDGEDIAKEFTIHVKVCVNHRWGQVCEHDWKQADRGHSVGVLEIPVKFYKNK